MGLEGVFAAVSLGSSLCSRGIALGFCEGMLDFIGVSGVLVL